MKQWAAQIRNFFPSLQDLIFVIVSYSILRIGTGLFRDGDPGRHITIGKYILQNHTIQTHDIFSYTMYGQLFTPHEWLAQVAYGAAYLLFGLNGVVLLAALLIAMTVVLIYREILRREIPYLIAFGLAIWAAALTSVHWLARPHLFTFLFLALWTPRLIRLTRGESVPLWQFPLIMLLWANFHGAFIAGFVVWGACLAGWLWDTWRKSEKPPPIVLRNLLFVGSASFLVTFINPVGWRLWATSLGYISNRYMVNLTSEYRSPDFHEFGAWPFLIFIAVALLVLSRAEKKLSTTESLLLAGWTMLGVYSGRNIPLFSIVVIPIFAGYIQPALKKLQLVEKLNKSIADLEHQLRGVFWSASVFFILSTLLIAGYHLDAAGQGYHFNSLEFPVGAVDWLESHPQEGNLFNYFPWGGYLIYRMWPGQLVFIDGQLDFYGETLTQQHQQVINADQGWEDVVRQYKIQWMLVPTNSTIAKVLQKDPTWTILYQDQTSVIYRQY